MYRSLITLAALSIAVATPFIGLQAQAVQRTHVSAAFGADSNTASNCTVAAPCRLFQAAMTVTDPNGEVIVLDSGGYGAVNITQSVALIAPTGVYAGISVFPGADGVTIATAGVKVVLRGLTINGQGGNNGINMTAGSSLTVENCVISNLTHGINMTGGNSLTVENCVISNLAQHGINVNAVATARVTDTIVRDNGLHGIYLRNGVKATITRAVVSGNVNSNGIRVEGSVASTTTADIADSTFDGNFVGVFARSTSATAVVKVSVRDSRAVRNVDVGLVAQSNSGAAVSLSASNNIVANSNVGIAAFGAGAKVWASGNTVSDNASIGLQNGNALFETAGNNAVRNNGVNLAGAITAFAPQ